MLVITHEAQDGQGFAHDRADRVSMVALDPDARMLAKTSMSMNGVLYWPMPKSPSSPQKWRRWKVVFPASTPEPVGVDLVEVVSHIGLDIAIDLQAWARSRGLAGCRGRHGQEECRREEGTGRAEDPHLSFPDTKFRSRRQ